MLLKQSPTEIVNQDVNVELQEVLQENAFDLDDRDVIVAVVDSHRPINLANIYDKYTVLLFCLDQPPYPTEEELEELEEDSPEVQHS